MRRRLLEANHTPRFWSIVRSRIPPFAKAKSWLRELTPPPPLILQRLGGLWMPARVWVPTKRMLDQRRCGVGAFCNYLCVFIHVWAEPQNRKDDRKQAGSSDGTRPNTHCGSRGGDKANHCYAGPEKSNPEDEQEIYVKFF